MSSKIRNTDSGSCSSDVEAAGVSNETTPLLRTLRADEASEKKNMLKCCCSVSAGVVGVACIILGTVVAILFDPVINSIIDEELIIKNGSENYKFWVNPPIVPYLNVYFFNLTNSKEFLDYKAKPIFKEVGPYAYKEKWAKVNISFHDNGTVSYQTKKKYYFDRSESQGPETDIIHTLNVPVTVAAQKVSKMGRLAQLALSSMLDVLKETAFVSKTVDDLVWGYEDRLINLSRRILPPSQQMPFDKFGFFYQKNDSADGRYNVFTGAGDISKYAVIDTFDSSHELTYWNTPECNRINGTDGTSYPPNIEKTDTLYLFNDNLCRSLPLIYNNTVKHYGLETYRFVPPKDVFADVSKKPDNMCFCVGGPPCIGGGVFNISSCKFNISSIISWPHFYQADAKYLNAVSGLSPNEQKHSLYIDVNPRLGVPLAAQARVQVNFFTVKTPYIKSLVNMPSMVFPVIWFEDGVTKLPPQLVEQVEKSTFLPKVVKASSLTIFFVLGILLLITAAHLYASRRKTESSASITKPNASTDYGHTNPAVSPENPD